MANRKTSGNNTNIPKVKPPLTNKTPNTVNKSKVQTEKSSEEKSALRWLLWGGAAITLVIWLSLNDPFNAPKSWVLSISAFWLLGWLVFNFKRYLQNSALKQTTFIAAFFALAFTAAWIATDNKFVGFFGQDGRKTGLLAYLSFIICFTVAAYLIRLNRILKLERTVVFIGSILGIYGFFQHYKIDFIKWNYLYNSVLGTLGNPDFAGAMMAILLVLNFGVAIQSKHQIWFRAVAGFNVALLAVVIVFSQARQGLLAAGLGLAFVALVWLYQRNKKASLVLSGLSILAGITVLAGMLNVGPLTRFFYKVSVTYRGDYWRAAIRMFIHHPIFGVGLDRYGANFRQYRDATETLRRGPTLVADAAHSVPLQLAATGGIFVLLGFLALTIFIAWRGIVALRSTTGTTQLVVAIIFAAWITYQAQSLISLDNIGIAIWGYLLGGALVGISVQNGSTQAHPAAKSMAQPIISAALALIFTITSFLFFQSEKAAHSLLAIIPPRDPALIKEYESFVNKPLSYLFKEPTFSFAAAQDYRKVGDDAKAISTLRGMLVSDPRNIDALSALGDIYSSQKSWSEAIAIDNKMVKLDPFNQITLLKLGRDEKSSGNLAAAKAVIPIINSFAPNSAEAKLAQTEFGK